MQSLLDSITDVVVTLDNSWRCTYLNPKAEELFGNASDVLGKSLCDAYPERLKSEELISKLSEARSTGQAQVFEQYLPSKHAWYQLRLFPNEEGVVIILIDITAQKRHDAEHHAHDEKLEKTQRELEAAIRSKDRFIAQVSHELRTPLTPVMINLSLLEEMLSNDLDAQTLVGIIRRNLQHEIRLIDDLLDATRITNGKLRLKHQAVELHLLIANAISLTKHVIEEKDLRINLTLLAGDDKVWADETRMQQIFWNLLHNAAKFAPQGSSSRIRTSTRGGYIVITVQDEGKGIDPMHLPTIFEPFEQTDPNVTQNYGGLGLGLAITRSLVHLHGGYITAHSEGHGTGATFRIQLPLMSFSEDGATEASVHYRDVVGYSEESRIPRIEGTRLTRDAFRAQHSCVT
jgi:PAS domain S-box-containing protein